ncbi:hypothetical protein B0H19DRAFT_1370916 [Mycena capillaripes]|nr:hypothetical protein B0H19DRAFT_1370916 [Mycena capillaripes]
MSIQMGKFTIPVLVGTLVNWRLQGALFVQLYIYFLAFPKDKLFYKLVVGLIVVAEILQTLGDTKDTVRIFGDGYGNPEVLELVGWAWFSTPIAGSTIACVGQLFFAWRIFVLSDKLYIPALVAVVTHFQFGAGIWTGVLICRAKTFIQLQCYTLKPPAAWLAATALADLIIVAATAFYVRKRSEPGFSRPTLAALSRILRVTAETGVLCALFAIVDLFLFVTYSGNSYHLGVCIWLSKVYSNSIMVILNSRANIGHGPPDGTNRMTEVVFQSNSSSSALQVAAETTQTTNGSLDFRTFTQTQSTADKAEKDFGMGLQMPGNLATRRSL